MKMMIRAYKALAIAGDLGLVGLYEQFFGPIIPTEGLPKSIDQRTMDYLLNGKLIRGHNEEMKWYHRTLKRADPASQFGSKPIRIFYGDKPMSAKAKAHYEKRGIDLEKRKLQSQKMRADFKARSTNSKVTLINGDHNSMYTLKRNADIICHEILDLSRELESTKG